MTSYSSAFIVIATVWLSCTSSAKAEEFGDPVKGMELAISMCAECHAVGEDTKDSPEPNAPSFRAVAAMPSTTRMAISAWFRSPHPSMPSLIIEDENANDLIAYILSLKGK